MSDKLFPCPFCGKSVADITDCHELEDCENFEACKDEGYVSVTCDINKGGCGASSGYFRTREEAIAAWNRRTAGWIPTTERLPKENGSYLCWFIDGFYGVYDWGGKYSLWEDVTHWMPLPAPPAEKEE